MSRYGYLTSRTDSDRDATIRKATVTRHQQNRPKPSMPALPPFKDEP